MINNNDELLPGHEATFVWFDTQCDIDHADISKEVFEVFKPHVFIGPGCSVVVEEIFKDVFNPTTNPFPRPLISWAAANPSFADKDEYPQFSRVVPSYTSHNAAVIALVEHYGWQDLFIVGTGDSLWGTTLKFLKKDLVSEYPDVNVYSELVFSGSQIHSTLTTQRDKVKDVRVILMLGYCEDMLKWIAAANDVDMLEGYAVLLYDFDDTCTQEDSTVSSLMKTNGVWSLMSATPETNVLETAFLIDKDENPNDYNFNPYLSYPFGTASPMASADPTKFRSAMEENDRSYVTNRAQESTFSVYLHDAIMLYAHAAHDYITAEGPEAFEGGNSPVTYAINHYIRSVEFEGMTGLINVDARGERNLPIQISYAQVPDTTIIGVGLTNVASYNPSTDSIDWTAEQADLMWAGGVIGGTPPGLSNIIDAGGAYQLAGLGLPALISIAAGTLTIITTVVLFKIRYNAARETVSTGAMVRKMKSQLENMTSNVHTKRKSISKMNDNEIEVVEMKLAQRRELSLTSPKSSNDERSTVTDMS
jgi:hypothetical protein